MTTNRPRHTVSKSAGSQPGKPFAVLDNEDAQGGKGKRRVSFHRTFKEAQTAAQRLNSRSAENG